MEGVQDGVQGVHGGVQGVRGGVQMVHGGLQGVQARRVELLLLARELGLELGLHELQLRDLPQLHVLLGQPVSRERVCRAHLLLEARLLHPVLLALLRKLDQLLRGLGARARHLVALLP